MNELEERIATLEAIIVGLLDEVVQLKANEAAREERVAAERKIFQVTAQRAGKSNALAQLQAQSNASAQSGISNQLAGTAQAQSGGGLSMGLNDVLRSIGGGFK
jgi:hypothetical protein